MKVRRLPTQVSFEDILEVTHCSLDHRVERLVLDNNILSDDIDELATHYKSNRIIFVRLRVLMSPICIWLNPEIRSRRPDTIKYQNKQLMLNQNLLQ